MCFYQTPGRHPPRITGRYCCDRRSDFMAQSLVCRSMSVEDSESRRFESTFGGVFSGRLGPTSAHQELLFSEFFKKNLVWNFFSEDFCAHSERYYNLMAGIFGILFFLATSRFHCFRSTLNRSTTETERCKQGHTLHTSTPAICDRRGIEILSPVFYTEAPKCVCVGRLAGASHLSPAVL